MEGQLKQKNMRSKTAPMPVCSGILAPILFVSVFTIEGLFREHYSPLTNFISELSIGDRAWVQIANFLLFGFLFFIFSFWLLREFRKRKFPPGGPILFLILASCYFFSGLFVTDPGTIFTQQKSVHGIIHGVLGAAVFLLMTISAWTFLKLFRKNAAFRTLQRLTLFFAIILTLALTAFTYVTKTPASQSFLPGMNGLFQRLALIPFMLWLLFFASSIRHALSNYDRENKK